MQNLRLLIKGKQLGPFSLEQVKSMRARGDCDSLTRVSLAGNPDNWIVLDAFLKQIEREAAQPKVATPPPIGNLDSTSLRSPGDIIRPFPVFAFLLLHFLTLGVFSFFWILSRHGVLPKFRDDDPSTSKAILICLVPFYNLYWLVVVLSRLVDRLNQSARTLQVQGEIPKAMGILLAILYIAPIGMAMIGSIIWATIMFSPKPPLEQTALLFFWLPQILTLIGFLLVMPIFGSQIQILLNAIFARQLSILMSGNDKT